MQPNPLNYQRLKDLEKLLKILYKKLAVLEEELAIRASAIDKLELVYRIRETRIEILKKEAENEKLRSKEIDEILEVSDVDANKAIVQVTQGIKHIEKISPEHYPDPETLYLLLKELHKILNYSGKTAQAKLKLSLPIIPLLASYELEMDTEAFLVEVWSAIKSMVRRKA
jgi:hypothetical protein